MMKFPMKFQSLLRFKTDNSIAFDVLFNLILIQSKCSSLEGHRMGSDQLTCVRFMYDGKRLTDGTLH